MGPGRTATDFAKALEGERARGKEHAMPSRLGQDQQQTGGETMAEADNTTPPADEEDMEPWQDVNPGKKPAFAPSKPTSHPSTSSNNGWQVVSRHAGFGSKRSAEEEQGNNKKAAPTPPGMQAPQPARSNGLYLEGRFLPEGQFWTQRPVIQILNQNEHARTPETQRISIDRKTTLGNPFYFNNAIQGERDKSVAAFNDLICRIEVSNDYPGDKMLEDYRCAHGLSIASGKFDSETFKADISALMDICKTGQTDSPSLPLRAPKLPRLRDSRPTHPARQQAKQQQLEVHTLRTPPKPKHHEPKLNPLHAHEMPYQVNHHSQSLQTGPDREETMKPHLEVHTLQTLSEPKPDDHNFPLHSYPNPHGASTLAFHETPHGVREEPQVVTLKCTMASPKPHAMPCNGLACFLVVMPHATHPTTRHKHYSNQSPITPT